MADARDPGTTETNGDGGDGDSSMTTGQLALTAGLCLLVMVAIVGAVVMAANGSAMPNIDIGSNTDDTEGEDGAEMDPNGSSEDGSGEDDSSETDDEDDAGESDEDTGSDELLPGADEDRASGDEPDDDDTDVDSPQPDPNTTDDGSDDPSDNGGSSEPPSDDDTAPATGDDRDDDDDGETITDDELRIEPVIVDYDQTVDAGDTVEVEVAVRANAPEESGEVALRDEYNGLVVDTAQFQTDEYTDTVTLEFPTNVLSEDRTHPLTAEIENAGSDTVEVTVIGTDNGDDNEYPDGHAEIQIVDYDESIRSGETVSVTAEVTTNDDEFSGQVRFFAGDPLEEIDGAGVDVSEDETQTLEFEYESDELPGGEFDVRVNVDPRIDQDERTVRVTPYEIPPNGNDDNGNDDEWTDEEREEATEMLAEYYAGYQAGISMATDSGWAHEQGAITSDGPGEQEPWPLEEWDSPEEAFEEGMDLGAGEGAEPIEEEYHDKRDEHTSENDSDSNVDDDVDEEELIEAYYESRAEAFVEESDVMVDEQIADETNEGAWTDQFESVEQAEQAGQSSGISTARSVPDGIYNDSDDNDDSDDRLP